MVKLSSKELLQDALVAEKFLVTMYDQFLKESSCVPLLDLLLDNYAQNAEAQHEVFMVMKERDMYPVENAEAQKIQQTITMLKENTRTFDKDF